MNTTENTLQESPALAHAIALATAHTDGAEQRCRRWRRRAAVCRGFTLALFLAVALFGGLSARSATADRPVAQGALSTDMAVENVRQMLLNR